MQMFVESIYEIFRVSIFVCFQLTVKSLEENLEKAEEKLKELQKDLPVKMETEEEEENEDEDPNVAEEEESAADCQIKKQKVCFPPQFHSI